MSKKNILFIIGNEYHLYSSLCLFYKYFNSDEYCFKLVITKRPKNQRITKNYKLPFEHFVIDDYLNFGNFRSVKSYPDYNKILESIFERVDEIYTYVDFTLLFSLILNWAKRNPKLKSFLLQEGVAGYFTYKMPLYKMIKFFLVYLYVVHFKKVKKIDFVYQWGFYSKIDYLRMVYPDEVKIKTHAVIEKLDLDISPDINSEIKKVFNFIFECNPKQRYIFYMPIGLARGSKDAKNKEYDVINRLIELAKIKNLKFIIKVKAGVESTIYKERYGSNAKIIDDKIPAELLISDIHNSYIISAFSSAALHNVNNNKYFWIYPTLDFKTNLKPFTPNIKLINSLAELEQCIN